MKQLELTKGKFAIIDDEDYEYLSQWKWSFDDLYAVRGEYLGKLEGKYKYKKIYMHKVINQTPKGLETDHINHDKLDNRRCNLRSVTKSQNNRNRTVYKKNISGVIGVNWYKQTQRYNAFITINGKRIHLGYYINFEDAVLARKKAEELYFSI
jgi:hypothetical protein